MEKKRIGKPQPLVWKVEAPLAVVLFLVLYWQKVSLQPYWIQSIFCISIFAFAVRHFLKNRKVSFLHSIHQYLGYTGVLLCLSPYLLASLYAIHFPYLEPLVVFFGASFIVVCLYLYLQKDNEHVASYYFIYLLFLSQVYSQFIV